MERLVGKNFPHISLRATIDRPINLAEEKGLVLVFCYPYTGRPDVSDPPGWDDIPGAHGSTPQALSYSKLYEQFQSKRVKVFGLSFQTSEWQQEFSHRHQLSVPLLSDHDRLFATALTLPTFQAGSESYMKRVTILGRDGTIIGARFVTGQPADDAAESLALLG